MKVKKLIEKLEKIDQNTDVWMEDSGEEYSSEATARLYTSDELAEDVRAIKEGVLITKY